MKEFRIYTNTTCNCQCPFCSYGYRRNSKFISSNNVWDNPDSLPRLEKLRKAFDVNQFMFSGVEPTLDNRWLNIALYCYLKHVWINTNGAVWNSQNSVAKGLYDLFIEKNKVLSAYVSVNPYTQGFNLLVKYPDMVRWATPYIVITKDTLLYSINAIQILIKQGYYYFYVRFEYPSKLTLPEIKVTLEDICAEIHTKVVFELAIDWNPKKWRIPKSIGYVEIRPSGGHDKCHAYKESLTIHHNGDIVGCPKHSYEEDQYRHIIGNLMTDSPELIKLSIREIRRNYCL